MVTGMQIANTSKYVLYENSICINAVVTRSCVIFQVLAVFFMAATGKVEVLWNENRRRFIACDAVL
jgi:hypothetical protein